MAQAEDIDPLFELYKAAFKWRVDKLFAWDDTWQMKRFMEDWQKLTTEVILLNQHLVGYIQTNTDDDLYLANIALTSSAQNQGLGKKLIELLKQRSTETQQRLHLSVHKINQRALKFYQREGFQIYQETDETLKMQWLKN